MNGCLVVLAVVIACMQAGRRGFGGVGFRAQALTLERLTCSDVFEGLMHGWCVVYCLPA